MINDEKEKEIVSMLEKQKNNKLFLEVTGYISRLDSYIYKLEKENNQLKQTSAEAIKQIKNNISELNKQIDSLEKKEDRMSALVIAAIRNSFYNIEEILEKSNKL